MLEPKDTDWLNGYKRRPIYMLSTRNTLQTSRHIKTENERMGIYSMQMGSKRKLE